jgi:hypothetical protein
LMLDNATVNIGITGIRPWILKHMTFSAPILIQNLIPVSVVIRYRVGRAVNALNSFGGANECANE